MWARTPSAAVGKLTPAPGSPVTPMPAMLCRGGCDQNDDRCAVSGGRGRLDPGRRHELPAEVLTDGLGEGLACLGRVVGPAGDLPVGVVVDETDLRDHRGHFRAGQEAEVIADRHALLPAHVELELLVQQRRDTPAELPVFLDRKSTRLNSSHSQISYA